MNTAGSRYMTVSFAERRAQIEKQNALAKAVRFIAEQATCAPVAQLLVPSNPFEQEN